MSPLSWCIGPCTIFNSLNTATMHRVSPRRSACDRCRSHKLRCVRLDQNPNGASIASNPESLMPCQRCLKAGAECVATAHLTAKSTGDNHPARHVSTSSSHSASPYQQRSPAADRQLNDFSIEMPPQSGPQAKRKNSGDPRPSKDASPPWAPTSLLSPPASDKSQRSSHASFLDIEKVGLESREFGPMSSLLPNNAGTSAHMLHYAPPADPIVSSNYFGTSTNMVVDQNLREQPMDLAGSSTEDCLHRLSQLSSKLLVDFGKSNSSNNMGDMMNFLSPPNSTPTWHQDGTSGMTTNYLSNTVSKLFESLQVFLETVEHLRPSPASSAASECSYSDHWDEPEFVSTSDDSQIFHNAITVDPMHGSSETHTSAADSASALDMPATMTILTCYTWLLKGYEMVLSGIEETLATQGRLHGLKTLPSIFPGPGLGTFALENNPDMQIEIVIHIGSQMLHRIEGILGIHVVSEGCSISGGLADRREILDTSSAAALLNIWFAKGSQGENSPGDPYGSRRMQINHTIDSIRRQLREYWRGR
ncbi:hypothetical protein F5B22DRAFT_606514 [Xylaria bambusicola]|uniref:uncharacterized protein n=1 Tax=Xylaria bambusicola TaxID=326684 RepID=UPI0020084227|nr:uncharacterized protein F5B22DRAFT_606514 [Xylaria bambusicola]KAI0516793.1 hypothetical protein F5B22DRAFT_606514 [Xylaria bambusicola]